MNPNGLSDKNHPKIAITVGDSAGVGPELALFCVNSREVMRQCEPVLFGPKKYLKRIAEKQGVVLPKIVDVPLKHPEAVEAGTFSVDTGKASYEAVTRAIDATMEGKYHAIVTGPIQKEAWSLAGVPFPGHTELLASRTGTPHVSMMLTSDTISCVLATIHIPLADVADTLTIDGILRCIEHAAKAFRQRLAREPRISVCGLNPHAGENGLFSHAEEENIIVPAIEVAKSNGISVMGPLSPDTAFMPQIRKITDVYVCMYHDQGLIPLKALSFDDAVNVTLGLPIVRTSVDHGTAMDLAGKGIARPSSMLSAISMALNLQPS